MLRDALATALVKLRRGIVSIGEGLLRAVHADRHEGRIAALRCTGNSRRSSLRSGHSNLLGWLLRDFEMSDFCAASG
jgi:hypothetical protein